MHSVNVHKYFECQYLVSQRFYASHYVKTASVRCSLNAKQNALKNDGFVFPHSSVRIKSYPASVNALRVPSELTGFRTLFTSFHHFQPDEALTILRDAVASHSGIGIFESTQRRLSGVLGMLITPLIVWLVTPFIRPFRWTRLLWTYLLPLVPLIVVFDGVVSVLRSYTVAELTAFTKELSDSGYEWDVGETTAQSFHTPVTYLIGYPAIE